MIHPDKVTSAQIAGAVDDEGKRASAWVFTLDNGARFEAHEVNVDGDWRTITAELASSIVDGAESTDDDLRHGARAVGRALGGKV